MILRKTYLKMLQSFKDIDVIKVITGIRRCGKSVLLEQYRQLLDKDAQIIKINFESIIYDDIKNYKDLYDFIMNKADITKKVYLLLDEIQRIDSFEKALSSFQVDLDCDIYITGSNAYLLSSELSTYLAGRYVEIHLFPLSFKEYALNRTDDIQKIFIEYMTYGGFPGLLPLLTAESRRIYMEGIYSSIVIKDILNRSHVTDADVLERILRYLLNNIGNLISANKISNYLTANYKKIATSTVISNMDALEKAFVIYKARRYRIKGKEILKTLNKFYVVDIGLRNMVEGFEINDRGRLLENIVYNELLRRGYHVTIGVDQSFEIDFIAIKGDEKYYYQVTLSAVDDNVKARELKGFMKLRDHYPKYLLSMDYGNSIEDGVELINIIDFLLS